MPLKYLTSSGYFLPDFLFCVEVWGWDEAWPLTQAHLHPVLVNPPAPSWGQVKGQFYTNEYWTNT